MRRLEYRSRIGTDTYKQALELAVCGNDLLHWANHWAWTYDPREAVSTLPFDLFPRQEEFLRWVQERERAEEDGLAEKSRDVGFTWLCCIYAVHAWLFRDGFKGAFGSRKMDLVDRIGDPDTIFEKIRFLLRNLPHWMLPTGFRWAEHDHFGKLLNPANGSALTGEGGDNIGRGGRASIYFVDEAAYLEHPQTVEAALSQTTRCRIWVSTPNGAGNPFYRKRFSGRVPVFTFHWRDDPRKDEAWYEREKARLDDPVIVAQEIDIDYSASVEGICIPAAWVRAAVDLPVTPSAETVVGLDVAEYGPDRNVHIGRRGPQVLPPSDWGQVNTTQTAHRAADETERLGAVRLYYDCVGVGAGVRGALDSTERKLAFQPVAVNVGESPTETRWPDGKTSKERFLNLRAELWWTLRTRFEKAYEHRRWLEGHEDGREHRNEELISIPNHPQLIADLSLPLAERTDTGKVKIESKRRMRERGVKSPNFGDALANTFVTEPNSWAHDPSFFDRLAARSAA